MSFMLGIRLVAASAGVGRTSTVTVHRPRCGLARTPLSSASTGEHSHKCQEKHYSEIISFHGNTISWFDNDRPVRGHLNSWISYHNINEKSE